MIVDSSKLKSQGKVTSILFHNSNEAVCSDNYYPTTTRFRCFNQFIANRPVPPLVCGTEYFATVGVAIQLNTTWRLTLRCFSN